MPPKQENPTCVYDFTCPREKINLEDLKKILKQHCKKWTFQGEKGESGYRHWQGRVSMKLKCRKEGVVKLIPGHISITSTDNRDNCFYVLKETTREDGPWCDTDVEYYIPRQIREIGGLYDWQQQIVNDATTWNTRTINIIYCPNGNIGKSILKTYIGCYQIGRALPYSNDYKDIMRMVMDTPKKPLYIIDLPRAISKDKLYQFFSGIETLKDGYAFDDRYHFKEEFFDCPNIWIFMNTLPDIDLLSRDRWAIWTVKDRCLIPHDLNLME